MKNKLISCVLIISILLLAGCSVPVETTVPTTDNAIETTASEVITAESLMAPVEELLTKSQSIDSTFVYHNTYTMHYDNLGKINVGETSEVKVKQHFPTDSTHIFYNKNNSFASAENVKSKSFFVVRENDDDIVYHSENNDWHRLLMSEYDGFQIPSNIAVNKLLKNIDNWILATEPEMFANNECNVVLGRIDNKNVVATINDILFLTELDEELNATLSMSIKIYFNKDTKMLKGIVINLDDVVGAENLEYSNYMITIEYYGFNDLNMIIVPENIKNYCLEKIQTEENS
jgi:hypothetical protein